MKLYSVKLIFEMRVDMLILVGEGKGNFSDFKYIEKLLE